MMPCRADFAQVLAAVEEVTGWGSLIFERRNRATISNHSGLAGLGITCDSAALAVRTSRRDPSWSSHVSSSAAVHARAVQWRSGMTVKTPNFTHRVFYLAVSILARG